MKTKEKLHEESIQIRRLGNRAVRKARAENRKLGIPNTFSRHEEIYFELFGIRSHAFLNPSVFMLRGQGALPHFMA